MTSYYLSHWIHFPNMLMKLYHIGRMPCGVEDDVVIASYVKEVVVFAGAIYHPCNHSPIAEANVHSDPHAADIVFSADWPLTALTLDASEKPQITNDI